MHARQVDKRRRGWVAEPVGAPARTRLPAGVGNHALARWLARDPVLLAPGDRLAQLEAAGPVEAARVFHQLEAPANAAGKVYVELPAECALLDAAEIARLKPRAFARKEQAFAKFATDRAPRFAAMSGAADTTTRRTAAVALSAFDAGRLTELRAMQAALGGEWDIKDPIARDAVLAALQLEAATDADGDLLADRNAVHKRVVQSAGMELTDEWCGYFAQDNFRKAGLDKDLQAGFWAVDDVRDYCKYTYARHPKRILKWIWADGTWQVLKDYHAHRGALRRWLDYAAVSAGGALDIRPGDIVIVDWNRDGTADHIAIAQSYDPATSTLVTVGGNDSGLVLDAKPKFDSKGERKLGGESAEDKAAREEREAATGQSLKPGSVHAADGQGGLNVAVNSYEVTPDGKRRGKIFAVGRPSLVDFEDHPYDGTNQEKPPPPLKP